MARFVAGSVCNGDSCASLGTMEQPMVSCGVDKTQQKHGNTMQYCMHVLKKKKILNRMMKPISLLKCLTQKKISRDSRTVLLSFIWSLRSPFLLIKRYLEWRPKFNHIMVAVVLAKSLRWAGRLDYVWFRSPFATVFHQIPAWPKVPTLGLAHQCSRGPG